MNTCYVSGQESDRKQSSLSLRDVATSQLPHGSPYVLLIQNNRIQAHLLHEIFSELPAPFRLDWTDRLSSGLARLCQVPFDIVLLDLELPDAQDLEGLKAIQAQFTDVAVVVLATLPDEEVARRAIRGGAQDYLVTGQITADMLARSILYARERKRAEKELLDREAQLGRLQLATELHQAIEARDHIMAVVAHDLRAPLTSIRTRAHFLQMQAADASATGGDQLAEQIRKIDRAVVAMSRLINDLVGQIARMEPFFRR